MKQMISDFCDLKAFQDIPGGADANIGKMSLNECAEACIKNTECIAIVYLNEEYQYEKHWRDCILKYENNVPVSHNRGIVVGPCF